jgi:hypothetical protein
VSFLSQSWLIKSPSQSFKNAISIAKQADYYFKKSSTDGGMFYIAGFNNTPVSLERASILFGLCGSWRTTTSFVNGERRDKVRWFLDCYIEALKSNNQKLHCFGSAYVDNGAMFTTSCKLAKQGLFRTDIELSFEDQLRADAADQGCDLCPLFKTEVSFPKVIEESKVPKYW